MVACYDLQTGRPVWMHSDTTRFWEANAGAGPRGTPALSGDRVYALGATGILNALNVADSSVVWSRHAPTDTSAKTPGWTAIDLPPLAPDSLVSVIEIELACTSEVDTTIGLDPNIETEILAEFATVEGAQISTKRWTEKFGEWKSVRPVHDWSPRGKVTWEIEVYQPGDYNVSLTYTGDGRMAWAVNVVGGEHLQNQQSSSNIYQEYPMGWINFPEPGTYQVVVRRLEGKREEAHLKAIHFTPIAED